MIDVISSYGLKSPKVLSAISKVPREKFVGKKYKKEAYEDTTVDIGFSQTLSQPYTVAFVTDLVISSPHFAKNKDNKKILEVGTGSGYQAAVLSKLVDKVYGIEIIPELAKRARNTLEKLGINNVYIKTGSGEWGWKEKALFDAIVISAGVEKVPQSLFDQLKESGVLVAPVGIGLDKIMTRYSKSDSKIISETFGVFRFVPFVKRKV